MEVLHFHICQETPADPSSQGGSRDVAGMEAAHWEEEPTAGMDKCGRHLEAESER